MSNIKYSRGSEWRKWDLHIHSQHSKEKRARLSVEEIFKKAIQNNIEVIAITDHSNVNGLDGAWKFWEEENIKINGKTKKISDLINFLPAVELKSAKGKRGVHFIAVFPKKIKKKRVNKKYLEQEFLAKVDCSENDIRKSGRGSYKKGLLNHCVPFEKTVEQIRELGGIVIIHAGTKSGGIEKEMAHAKNNASDYEILNSLGPEKEKLMKKYVDICEIPSWDKKNQIEAKFYLKKFGKSTILSSDSHENFKGKKFTWIKADPTFEGLKQIIYEPEYRVHIGQSKPTNPTNFISSFELEVPNGAKVKTSTSEKQDEFILAGCNTTKLLSPYFNCFIGGRGVGKSTLLSLMGLHSNNVKEAEVFWREQVTPDNFDPETILMVDGCNDYEYIGQGQINSIASDVKKLTSYIYSRIKQNEGQALLEKEAALEELLKKLENEVKAFSEKMEIEGKVKELNTRKEILDKVAKLDEDEELQKKKKKLKEAIQKLKEITRGKEVFSNLRGELQNILERSNPLINDGNEEEDGSIGNGSYYEEAVVAIVRSISDAMEKIKDADLEKQKRSEEEIRNKVDKLQEEYEKLLEKKGISREDIKERSEAPSLIREVEGKLITLKAQLKKLENDISTDYIKKLNKVAKSYEKIIDNSIETVGNLLDKERGTESSLEEICIEHKFNRKTVWDDIATEFYERYEHFLERGLADNVRLLIQKEEIRKLLQDKINSKDLLDRLDHEISDSADFLKQCFKEAYAIEIFSRIRDKHLYNKIRYKELEITYDGEPLGKRSFGERATTALIVLLLFGNKPVIIDEPEAHLDSRLIADYLVELLKRIKSKRQVIFATHNANFVINGDAEQVYILNIENGRTKFTQTSIENLKHRETLLNLEGGKEAFDKRGNKYS